MNKPLEDSQNISVISELLKGPEWKNIEDIIKFTFRALNEIVISHSLSLKDIERSLASKVSKADFFSETSKKVDSLCFLDQLNDCRSEFRALVNEVDSKIFEKASVDDLHKIASEKVGKEQFEYTISSSKQENTAKYDKILEKIDGLACDLARSETSLKDLFRKLEEKVGAEELQRVDKEIQAKMLMVERSLIQRINQVVDHAHAEGFEIKAKLELMEKDMSKNTDEAESIRRKYEEVIKGKVSYTDFFKFSEETSLKVGGFSEFNLKASSFIDSAKEKLAGLEKTIFKQYTEYQVIHEQVKNMNEKSWITIENMQQTQGNHNLVILELREAIQDLQNCKASHSDLDLKADYNLVSIELSKKVDENTYFTTIHEVKSQISSLLPSTFAEFAIEQIDKLKKELAARISCKDLSSLLETKANIDDVNLALTQLHSELDSKLEDSNFEKFKEKQEIVNNAICMDRVIGRWRSNSGSVQRGILLWDRQVLSNDNFIWEARSSFILVLKGGIYALSLAFFSSKNANIQLLINGEVVSSAVPNAQFSVTGSTGKLRNQSTAGVSIQEHLHLSNKSRISVLVNVDQGEGYLDLKKLI